MTDSPVKTAPMFDELAMFAQWYMSQNWNIPMCPMEGYQQVGPFTGLILFREGQFQVQMWLCPPGAEAKEHFHRNVDTIQIYLSGEIWIQVNGAWHAQPDQPFGTLPDGTCSARGHWARVRPYERHLFKIGPKGGAFLTIERWVGGVTPGKMEEDWVGEPISEDHANRLREKVRAMRVSNGDQVPESEPVFQK